MVRDHSDMDRRAVQRARQWMLTPTLPDDDLREMARAEMEMLNAAGTGAGFDRAFMESQVLDHERTLIILDSAIGSAQRGELRTMLRDQVRPAVAAHLAQARAIQNRIGRP
jgi:putative membrane protein